MRHFVIVLLTSFMVCFSCEIIKVEEGEISGTTNTLTNGKVIYAFLGVPYAAPPTGELRFKEPQTREAWSGIWNATTPPSKCKQYSQFSYKFEGDEDCLYLNVFTPQIPQNGEAPLLDVLIFIHGGAFMFFSGTDLKPDYMLRENDVVLVFINYRLGPFGFLSTGDHVVPGNNGLKDQVAALEWVQRNIILFGGNPKSVTISGCSAGGASVHYHFMSPLSEGLFHKGISLSGSALPPWTLPKNNTERSFHLASLVGCPTISTQEMIECLRLRPAQQILQAAVHFQPWRYNPFTSFGPVIEPASPSAFLSEHPLKLLKGGHFKKLPWLISLNKDEGLYPAADFISENEALIELNERWNDIAPHLLFYNYSTSNDVEKADISKAIRKFYLNDQPLTEKTVSKLVEALGHRLFFLDIIRAATLQATLSDENVYCYMFNYRGKISVTSFWANNNVNYGVSHADDAFYLFHLDYPYADETESDSAVVSFMCSIITQFMKTGNPNVGLTDIVWEPLSRNLNSDMKCLHFNSPDAYTMGDVSYEEAFKFWRDTIPSEYTFY